MAKLKLVFLIILMICGNNLYSQNDSIKTFTKKTFQLSFISGMLNDSLAVVTKPYLSRIYNKIKIQNELINTYSKLNTQKYIDKLTSLNTNLEKEINKRKEIDIVQKQEINTLKELNKTTEKQVGFEKEKFDIINKLYQKEHKRTKTLIKIGYIAIPATFIIGFFIGR